jgi:hypothetical protein
MIRDYEFIPSARVTARLFAPGTQHPQPAHRRLRQHTRRGSKAQVLPDCIIGAHAVVEG